MSLYDHCLLYISCSLIHLDAVTKISPVNTIPKELILTKTIVT